MTAVSAPASSANLGPGFDVLGLALSRRTVVGTGSAPAAGRELEESHPAVVAHRAAGGSGSLWGVGGIPMGRGLGYSGAVRVAGAMLAHVERDGVAAAADHDTRVEVLRLTAELEGHPDNVAASVFGGMVIADGDLVSPASVDLGLSVVVWVPAAPWKIYVSKRRGQRRFRTALCRFLHHHARLACARGHRTKL